MDGMDMSSGMSMGNGVPAPLYLQKMYWAVMGSAIAAATVVNILNRFLASQRLRDITLTPSKPKTLLFNTYATITALAREFSYATLPPISIGKHTYHFAPLGPISIILANLIIVLVFCFYKLDPSDQWKWEDVGYRTGFIALAQLPLIFLLAGRQNLIGLLVDMSYDRLNYFHRWVSRTLWLTVTIHMAFWFRNWDRYNYIIYQLKNDHMAQTGFAAWCILTWIVLSSAAPVRRWGYEFFVLQHLVTFIGFIVAVYLHVDDNKVWVWIPIGLLIFDRAIRYLYAMYANISLSSKHWVNRASFTPFPGNITRITIDNPGISWKPGQHAFLTCHSVVPLQSHPFTIASIPEDRKMEFYIRSEKGGTRRFFSYASKHQNSAKTVFIEGPYGTMRPLRQFDSVVFFAGGTGATFTTPCLRDIVAGWKTQDPRQVVTKRIRYVWVIKSRAHLSWLETQLQSVLADVADCQRQTDIVREIELSVYITCDETLEPATIPVPLCNTAEQTQTQPPAIDVVDNEKDAEKEEVSIHSISPNDSGPKPSGCPPDGGCCCITQITDETITPKPCCCSGPAPPPSPSRPSSPPKEKAHPLTLLNGRPRPHTIIRSILEKATGESAVVVCGPAGLADDVRRSVVSLSDERAVHKGSGAQGVYLHVEGFGW